MDVLSSQANIAGYKAVMLAANTYQRFMPMLMTAAGTVKAARVLIMGVGVAGLQAIATAKRLGAVIEASDVRPPVKEQVESLGAKFIDVPFLTDEEKRNRQGRRRLRAADAGRLDAPPGRAGARARQAGRHHHHHRADPGPPGAGADREETVKAMKPGSVIVDLAVEQGGNCPLSELGKDRDQTRRAHRRRAQPGHAGGGRRLGAVRAQRAGLPQADHRQGRPASPSNREDEIVGHAAVRRRRALKQIIKQESIMEVSHTIINLIIFVLAIYVGYHVVWTVTPALHTPLMAVTNAISAIIIVGAMLAAGLTEGRSARSPARARRGAGRRQRVRRLPGHAAHAGDVQEERAQGEALTTPALQGGGA
jgi:NAD/NADP transhydrogenase alpha subunit